ncbi:MAG: hypothetical protein ACI4Q9_05190 [Candidatus Methanomethylophilaceae archaeon]
MKTNMIVAICLAALVVAGGAAVVIGNQNNDTTQDSITVNDSLGNDVTLPFPIKKIATVNTHAAEFLEIVGASDLVVAADNSTIDIFPEIYGGCVDLGKYNDPSGELAADAGVQVLICQSASRSFSAATESALLNNFNIKVLRLDCYGSTMLKDVEELLKLIDSADSNDRYDTYKEKRADIIDSINDAASLLPGEPGYMFMFATMGSFYNANSELNSAITAIHGKDVITKIMDGNIGTGVTSKPSNENICNYDNETGIDYVFIRSIEGKSMDDAYQKLADYMSGLGLDRPVKSARIFVIETDVLAGPKDYVGLACIAGLFGADIGVTPQELIADYNASFGLSETYDCLTKEYATIV